MQRLQFVILLCSLWAFTCAEQSVPSHSSWPGSKADNEFYIDDEGLEGSGAGHREVKDDLESSGSGYGPDDEDDTDILIDKTRVNRPGDRKPGVKVQEPEPTKVLPPIDVGVDEGPVHPAGTPDPNHPDVHILGRKNEDRPASFFAQPGILAAVIGGAVVGLFCAILLVMFIVYRMRKKDEGSYALDEPKSAAWSTMSFTGRLCFAATSMCCNGGVRQCARKIGVRGQYVDKSSHMLFEEGSIIFGQWIE